MLDSYIANRLRDRPILLMSHIVIGYPDFPQSLRLVDAMVNAGVDLMELQIPFSEPIADGPVIARANQQALLAGSSVERCLAFARDVSERFPIPFLFMSYYNILFRRGPTKMVSEMASAGIKGAIVPDLPPEEATEYLSAAKQYDIAPIFIFTPTTSDERLNLISKVAEGFVYCVARQGVTGQKTNFTQDLDRYLARCREATRLPLALGFGVRNREDVEYLHGKVDVAVVGSETLRVFDEHGVNGAGDFIRSLRT
jgi:tryptophan synthase alpha chain